MESGGGGRRRRSLTDEKVDLANLRDFLRVKQDDDGRNLTGVTLSAMLGSEKRATPSQVNRTLLDIIRDDPNGGEDNKKSWKAFRDKIRLHRAGATWTSTVPTPASDVPIQNRNRMMSRRNSTRLPITVVNSEDPTSESNNPELSSSSVAINGGENRSELNSMPSNRAMMVRSNSSRVPSLSANLYGRGGEGSTSYNTSGNNAELRQRAPSPEGAEDEEEEEEETEESAERADEGGEQPVRMSLMALLAETDRQMGLEGSAFMMDDEEEEVERGGGEFNCCVCMVRHKGSAFIPCGHTFCRLCSRELWVQRGNCPLCNGFILEILDIF